MKKLATVLAAIFLVTILTAAFAGCSPDHTPGEIADNYTDLASEGEFSVSSGDEGESAVFEFGKEITFNTLILRENGSKILQFDLYADCHIFLWTLFDSLCMLVGYACSFFNPKTKRMSFMNLGVMSLLFAIYLAIIGLLCVCKNSRAFTSKSL